MTPAVSLSVRSLKHPQKRICEVGEAWLCYPSLPFFKWAQALGRSQAGQNRWASHDLHSEALTTPASLTDTIDVAAGTYKGFNNYNSITRWQLLALRRVDGLILIKYV